MNIVEIVNRQLLFHYFYEFLLEELKTYINGKLDESFVEITELYANSKEFPIMDRILVESFVEVGRQSYSAVFSKLDMTQSDKIMRVIDSGKKLFNSVKEIEDETEEKNEQYYTMFELVGPFMYESFVNQSLLIDILR